jgi:hypothetical protein
LTDCAPNPGLHLNWVAEVVAPHKACPTNILTLGIVILVDYDPKGSFKMQVPPAFSTMLGISDVWMTARILRPCAPILAERKA